MIKNAPCHFAVSLYPKDLLVKALPDGDLMVMITDVLWLPLQMSLHYSKSEYEAGDQASVSHVRGAVKSHIGFSELIQYTTLHHILLFCPATVY